MIFNVVHTISQSNIGKHIVQTRSLMKSQYTTSKKRTQYQTTKFEINQIPTERERERERENKPANRGKITNFHWNQNKCTEQCLPLLQVIGDWKNNSRNHGSSLAVDGEAADNRGSFGLIVSLFLYYAIGFSLLSPNSILGNMLF